MSVSGYHKRKLLREKKNEKNKKVKRINCKIFIFALILTSVFTVLTFAFLAFILTDMYGYSMPYQNELRLHVWLSSFVIVLILAVFLGSVFAMFHFRKYLEEETKVALIPLFLIITLFMLIGFNLYVTHNFYLDIIQNDYVIYTGLFSGKQYRSNVIILNDEDKTQVYGEDLTNDVYTGTVIYARHSKICLEMNEELLCQSEKTQGDG